MSRRRDASLIVVSSLVLLLHFFGSLFGGINDFLDGCFIFLFRRIGTGCTSCCNVVGSILLGLGRKVPPGLGDHGLETRRGSHAVFSSILIIIEVISILVRIKLFSRIKVIVSCGVGISAPLVHNLVFAQIDIIIIKLLIGIIIQSFIFRHDITLVKSLFRGSGFKSRGST